VICILTPQNTVLPQKELDTEESVCYSWIKRCLIEIHTEFNYLADKIRQFISAPKTVEEYRDFVSSAVFKEALETKQDDPVWSLLAYLENETDFYAAPASTKYHSNERSGLVKHSLLVAANGIKLAPIMLDDKADMYYLVVSCLFHDLCKVNMYEQKTRNVKNEATGKWEQAPYYKIRED
jgi:23S rRNA maturation-related 3'-5' exoribonuclease YhaM